MLDFGQEKRAKRGSRGSEAAVQSSKAPEEQFKVQRRRSRGSKFKCSRAAVQSPTASARLCRFQSVAGKEFLQI